MAITVYSACMEELKDIYTQAAEFDFICRLGQAGAMSFVFMQASDAIGVNSALSGVVGFVAGFLIVSKESHRDSPDEDAADHEEIPELPSLVDAMKVNSNQEFPPPFSLN